jgi:hypothetical protein
MTPMKKLFMSALVTLFILVTTSGPGFGAKVTVTLLPGGDATVGTAYPTYNDMGGTTLGAGLGHGYAGLQKTRAYLKFYLDSIPANATFLSATLSLFCWSSAITSSPPNPNFDIHYVSKAWDEWVITWNNQPGFDQLLARIAIPDGTFNVRKNWDLLADHSWDYAADLQGGKVLSVLLKYADETLTTDNIGQFESKEYSNPDWRPYLRIEYEVPNPPRHTVPLGLLLDD